MKCEGRAAPIGWFAIIRDLVTRASCCSSIGDCVAKVFPAFVLLFSFIKTPYDQHLSSSGQQVFAIYGFFSGSIVRLKAP